MNLSDDQLRRLVASDPTDKKALAELRNRTLWAAVRCLPAPTGVCEHGLSVFIDCKGVYSSGYTFHSDNHSVCDGAIKWDEDDPRTVKLRLLVEDLR